MERLHAFHASNEWNHSRDDRPHTPWWWTNVWLVAVRFLVSFFKVCFVLALQTLCHELGGILPTVSDRNAQLSRWMQSIQEAWLKLDHIERTSDNRSPHFQSQDFLRQHQLLALNTYLGKSRANCLPSEKAVVIQQYLEEVRVHESGASPTTQSESTHSPKPLRSSFPSDSDRIAVSNHDHEQHAGTIHVQQAIAQNEVAEGSRTQTELHPVSSTCGSGPRQPRGSFLFVRRNWSYVLIGHFSTTPRVQWLVAVTNAGFFFRFYQGTYWIQFAFQKIYQMNE